MAELRLNFATLPQQQRVTPEPPQEIINPIGQGERAYSQALGSAIESAQGQFQLAGQERKEGLQQVDEGIDALLKERKVQQIADSSKFLRQYNLEQAQERGNVQNDTNIPLDQKQEEYNKRLTSLHERFTQATSHFDKDVVVRIQEKLDESIAKSTLHMQEYVAQGRIERSQGETLKNGERLGNTIATTPEEVEQLRQDIVAHVEDINRKESSGIFTAEAATVLRKQSEEQIYTATLRSAAKNGTAPEMRQILENQFANEPAKRDVLLKHLDSEVRLQQEKKAQDRRDRDLAVSDRDEKKSIEFIQKFIQARKNNQSLDSLENELLTLLEEEKNTPFINGEPNPNGMSPKAVNTLSQLILGRITTNEAERRARDEEGRSAIRWSREQTRYEREEEERKRAITLGNMNTKLETGELYRQYGDDIVSVSQMLKANGVDTAYQSVFLAAYTKQAEDKKNPEKRIYHDQAEAEKSFVKNLLSSQPLDKHDTLNGALRATVLDQYYLAINTELNKASAEKRAPDFATVRNNFIAQNGSNLTAGFGTEALTLRQMGIPFDNIQQARTALGGANTSEQNAQDLVKAEAAERQRVLLNNANLANKQAEIAELERKKKEEEVKKGTTTQSSTPPSSSSTTSAAHTTPVEAGAVYRPPIQGGRITSGYGERVHPITGQREFHNAIDKAVAAGTVVGAWTRGRVKFAGTKGGYGNVVVLEHENGYTSLYAHLGSLNVKEGDTLSVGQALGTVGSTGSSTGAHLHVELMKDGQNINPTPIIEGRAINAPGSPTQGFTTGVRRRPKLEQTDEEREFAQISSPAVQKESRGDIGVQNPNSTATGKHQFNQQNFSFILNELKTQSATDPLAKHLYEELSTAMKSGVQPFRDKWTALAKTPELQLAFERVQDKVARENFWKPIAGYLKDQDLAIKQYMYQASLLAPSIVKNALESTKGSTGKAMVEAVVSNVKSYLEKEAPSNLTYFNEISQRTLGYFTGFALPFSTSSRVQSTQRTQEKTVDTKTFENNLKSAQGAFKALKESITKSQ